MTNEVIEIQSMGGVIGPCARWGTAVGTSLLPLQLNKTYWPIRLVPRPLSCIRPSLLLYQKCPKAERQRFECSMLSRPPTARGTVPFISRL